MALRAQLDAYLRTLAGDGGPGDLGSTVEDLLAATRRAVPGCLGVSVTVEQGAAPVTVTALVPGAEAVPVLSSLELRLPSLPGGRGALVLWSGIEHGLRDTRSEMLALLDLDPARAILDADLDLPAVADELGPALTENTAVDRALGALLDRRGLLEEQGRAHLAVLAAVLGTTVAGAALHVLAELPGPGDPSR